MSMLIKNFTGLSIGSLCIFSLFYIFLFVASARHKGLCEFFLKVSLKTEMVAPNPYFDLLISVTHTLLITRYVSML